MLGHHVARVHHWGVRHHGTHVRGQDGGPQVPWPVGAGECSKVLRQGWHAEGLVEDAAALVPVAEWVPAWGAEQGERNTSLSHGCCVEAVEVAVVVVVVVMEGCWLQVQSPLAALKMFSLRAVCLSAESFYTHRHLLCQQCCLLTPAPSFSSRPRHAYGNY